MKKMTIGTLMLALAFIGGWFGGMANGLHNSTGELLTTTDQCRNLTSQCDILQRELIKSEADRKILRKDLQDTADHNRYLVQQQAEEDITYIKEAMNSLEPEAFVVLNDKASEIVFKGFVGTLQWFTASLSEDPDSPQTDYTRLKGPYSEEVPIVDHGESGFRLTIPSGAKAYRARGGSAGNNVYSVEYRSN